MTVEADRLSTLLELERENTLLRDQLAEARADAAREAAHALHLADRLQLMAERNRVEMAAWQEAAADLHRKYAAMFEAATELVAAETEAQRFACPPPPVIVRADAALGTMLALLQQPSPRPT